MRGSMGFFDDQALTKLVNTALDQSYHDREGGWNSTAVKWWIRFCLARGEDPLQVAPPDAPDAAKLADEMRLMKFEMWLVEGKQPGVEVDTAAGYGSTVQGFLARHFGTKLGAGRPLERLKQMLRGLHRMRGGKPARRVRLALTPDKLAHAFLFLDASDPLQANVRAALAVMLQGLLRGGEAGVSDKRAGDWAPHTHVTRGDVTFEAAIMRIIFAPLKKETTLGAKTASLLIGAPEAHARPFIDATWEVQNMFVVDSVPENAWGDTPMFRDPATGKALTVGQLNRWVQHLMGEIGEQPSEYGSHSLRIGGATALFAQGASELDIRLMGRWDSEIYRIYVRANARRAAQLARDMACVEVGSTIESFPDWDLEVEF